MRADPAGVGRLRLIAVPKFLALEGLRGILALIVIVGHFGLNTVAGVFGLSVRYNLAVDIFFVISGFVLSHSYYFRERSFRAFLTGRFARLYPLHLVTFIWMGIVFLNTGRNIDETSAIETLLVINNVLTPPVTFPLNGPMWSTSIDILVSLLLWPAVKRLGGTAIVALLLGSWAVLVLRPFCFGGDAGACIGPVTSGFVRGVAGFVAGVAAYRLVSAWPEAFSRMQRLAFPLLCLLAASTLLPIGSALVPIGSLVAAMLAVAILARSETPGLLNSRAFVFLGSISYSLYLLHEPLYATLALVIPDSLLRGWVGKSLFLAAAVGCASVSHFLVELPLKRALLSRASRRIDARAAERGEARAPDRVG
jgi:peptidoglycan/LPS O-acetylase OafA/YrhL